MRITYLPGLFITMIFFLINSSSAFSQDVVRYDLATVITMAQEQSPDAQIAKHRFRRSYWEFRSFRATYLPGIQLDATMPNINRSINAISAQDGTTVYTKQSLTNFAVALSVNQKVGFSGGEVFLNTGLQRLDNSLPDTTTSQFLANMINIGFRQPIFSYNAYKWDKRIQPMKFEEAKRIYIETNEDVAITAMNHFFSLLLAQVEVGIAKKNQANYDTLFKIAQGRYNLGKIAENDLLQLELNLLKAQASVENAELNYENRLFVFKSYLRIKSSERIELVPPVETPQFEVSADRAIQYAKENTSSGIEFQRRLLEAESEVNMAKMNGRFDAELYATFGLTQTSFDIQTVYQNPLDEERVTFGITVPLLDWGKARGGIRMAESNQDMVFTSVEQDKIDFEQSIFISVMQFNMQEKQLKIAAKSDTVAQKRFQVTQQRYLIGKVNDVLELNNAQIDNDNARMNYYQSLLNYWSSYFQLRKNTLFDFQRDMPISTSFDDLLDR